MVQEKNTGEMAEDDEFGDMALEPTLENLLDSTTLNWIFVGGKGGVGKTTISSCLAILLAQRRDSVLLISTDPAHNLSDAFNQKFSKDPTPVEGIPNLSVMEIEPATAPDDLFDLDEMMGEHASSIKGLMKDLGGSLPGIDEISSFLEIMKQVNTMNFSVVVFDTAPTGHTLRLLALPSMLEKGVGKLLQMKNFGGMISNILGSSSSFDMNQLQSQVGRTKGLVEQISKQFQDPEKTTFVCVCIPEFLSVFETERLVQEITKNNIDTRNIVVNQLVFRPTGSNCGMCEARSRIQQKYLDQIFDLYEDFHVVQMPLLGQEVRGVPALRSFSRFLCKPYTQTDCDTAATEGHTLH